MPVVIGSATDPHVAAVLERLKFPPTVLDAATLATTRFTVSNEGLQLRDEPVVGGRGWLRRLGPPEWPADMREGRLSGAVHESCLSALAILLRDERIGWLTPLDQMAAAEGKPWQYRRASAAGAPVPQWRVTTDADAVRFGDWVAKPLGPGSYFDEHDRELVVPTARLIAEHLPAVRAAPFLFQHRVQATTHARILTVGTSVWSATLSGRDVPLDWRTDPAAHSAFTDEPVPPGVHQLASGVAAACCVGYSSQDWVADRDGQWWFLDLNPAGQWLFLPSSVADPVTQALAEWLTSGLT